ncbi:MAG: EAL domain-containing protein [Dehalococcoidia bacterium]|nr:EAL domain-containing protein [Dehalococcoidia bacterium]
MSRTDTAGRARLWPPAMRIFSPLATLRGRIIAGFALLVIMMALGAAGSAWQTRAHRSDLAQMQTAAVAVSLLQETEGDAAFAVALLQLYVSTGDEQTIPPIRSNLASAKEMLVGAEAAERALGHEQAAATFGQFLATIRFASEMAEQVITLRQRGDARGAAAVIAVAAPSLLSAKLEFDTFIEEERGELDDIRAQANQTGDAAFWFAVLGGAAGAIVAAAASVLIARSILRPLSRLDSAALAVASGDLEARAPETGPRELIRVGASFNQMTEALVELNRSLEEQVRERTAQLRASEVRYRSLTDNTFDLVLETSIDGRFTFASPSYRDVLGYEPDELLGTSIFDLVHPEDRPAVMQEFIRAVSTGNPGAAVYRSRRKDGEWLWMESAGKPFQSDAGEIRAVIVSRDITARKRAEETIRHMAYHDPLTGLPNRALFEDRLSVALAQARRAGQSLCLMSVDVDHFKLVNDTLGHAAGDAVLKAAGERLQGLVRQGDTVARIGGDEFILLLAGHVSAAAASRVATDIRNAFREPFPLGGQEVHATISIGISFYPQDGETADALIRNADAALYRAKDMGRSNYQLYAPSMNLGAAERLALDQELRDALEHEEFDIYYQPQLAIGTGQMVGAEALLRWRHPSRGVVSPDEFIPVAEETGLIVPLGKWVLRTAAAQVRAWLAAGLPPLRVAVNISMRQFQERDFVQTVAQALKDTGLDATHLELEITESTAMRDAAFTISVLRQLREMGIRISIDDFGTGHSSLRYLRDFPIHALKIDRSFIRDLTTDPNDAALVSEIIALAHRLGLEIVAEGVETQQQLNFLRDGGCDLFQGYLCARPMPADAFEECLRGCPCGKLFPPPRSKNGTRPARASRAAAGTRRRR